MFFKIRMIPGVAAMMMLAFVLNGAVLANTPAEPAEAPASEAPQITAQPPAESPDARALTGDELAKYGTMADSTSQNPNVQEMNVGATINTTVVLSVLVALVIFAILIAVL